MIDEFADAVFRAIESGDIAVWHNTDGVAQTKDQNLAVLGWTIENTASARSPASTSTSTPTQVTATFAR